MRTIITFILLAVLLAGTIAAFFNLTILPAIAWLVIGIFTLIALICFFELVSDFLKKNKSERIIYNLIVIVVAITLALIFLFCFVILSG